MKISDTHMLEIEVVAWREACFLQKEREKSSGWKRVRVGRSDQAPGQLKPGGSLGCPGGGMALT